MVSCAPNTKILTRYKPSGLQHIYLLVSSQQTLKPVSYSFLVAPAQSTWCHQPLSSHSSASNASLYSRVSLPKSASLYGDSVFQPASSRSSRLTAVMASTRTPRFRLRSMYVGNRDRQSRHSILAASGHFCSPKQCGSISISISSISILATERRASITFSQLWKKLS